MRFWNAREMGIGCNSFSPIGWRHAYTFIRHAEQSKQQQKCVHKNWNISIKQIELVNFSFFYRLSLKYFPRVFVQIFKKQTFLSTTFQFCVAFCKICKCLSLVFRWSPENRFVFDRFVIDIVICISKICCAICIFPHPFSLYSIANFEFVSFYFLVEKQNWQIVFFFVACVSFPKSPENQTLCITTIYVNIFIHNRTSHVCLWIWYFPHL